MTKIDEKILDEGYSELLNELRNPSFAHVTVESIKLSKYISRASFAEFMEMTVGDLFSLFKTK